MKKLLSLIVAGALGILLSSGVAHSQSSTQGGGFSTRAIQALEACFADNGEFICAPSGGSSVGTLGGTTNQVAKFTGATDIGDSDLLNVGVPIAGASGQVIVFSTALNAMDSGDDEVCIFCTTFTNAAHSAGELNTYFAGDITASSAQESAFYVEAIAPNSYDFALRQGGGAPLMRIAGDAAMEITAENGTLTLDSDLAGILLRSLSGSGSIVIFDSGTLASSSTTFSGYQSATGTTAPIAVNHVHTGLNLVLNGDDTVRLMRLEGAPASDDSSTGTGNTFTNIEIADVFNSTNVTQIGISIGSGQNIGIAGGSNLVLSSDSVIGDDLTFEDVPVAGVSGDVFEWAGTVTAMNGSDTVNIFNAAITNANHIGAGNELHAWNTEDITVDAQAEQTAYYIESTGGWDFAIKQGGPSTMGIGSDGAMFFEATGSFSFRDASSVILLTLDQTGDNITLVPDGTNANGRLNFSDVSETGSNENILALSATLNPMNGSDIIRGFHLDFNNADHTVGGNLFNAFDIDGITGDPQATENAINLGAGWDVDIQLAGGQITDSGTLIIDSLGSAGYLTINSEGDGIRMEAKSTGGYGYFVIVSAEDFSVTAGNSIKLTSSAEVQTTSDGALGTRHTVTGSLASTVVDIRSLVDILGTTNIDLFDIDFTPSILDGDDTIVALNLELGNANHVGANNFYTALGVSSIVGDAQATEKAIDLGGGWDQAIHIADGSSTDDTLTFGDSDDASIYWDNSNAFFRLDASNAATGGSVSIEWSDVDGNGLQLRQGGAFIHTFAGLLSTSFSNPANMVNFGFNGTIGAMNGSDTWNIVRVDITNADHTGSASTNLLRGIFVDDIVADANATETAVRVGDTWDFDFAAGDDLLTGYHIYRSDSTTMNIALGTTSSMEDRLVLKGAFGATPIAEIVATGAGAPTGNADDVVFKISSNVSSQVGGDNLQVLNLDIAGNASSTGGNLYGIYIDDLANSDANVAEGAINIDGDGWDVPLIIQEGADEASFVVPTLTANQTYTFPDATGTVMLSSQAIEDVQAETCPSSGDGAPGVLTLTPTAAYIEITNADVDGCTLTMGEGSAVEGERIGIVVVSTAGLFVEFSDTAAVSELAGPFSAGAFDSIDMRYIGDRWVERGRSDN